MSKRIFVVINPASGQPEPVLHTLNQVFHPAGVDWDVAVTKKYGDGMNYARQAAESGYEVVAAYGGDGTVMEVVNGLIGTGVPLAALPGGTGNVMSVELVIPQDLAGAAELAISPEKQIRPVDVGQCGEYHFLLRVYLGFDAQRIALTSREMRDRYGKAAYLLAAIKAMPESKAVRYQLTIDGEQVEIEGFTLMLENAGSLGMGDLSLAPDVSISDGQLDLFCMTSFDIKGLAAGAASITGRDYDENQFRHWQAREVTIASDPPQAVIGDGEDYGQTPITVRVLPGSVEVVTPQSEE
jgi:YegS/Rv2252/BmrU family lipid kinase